MKNNEKKEEKIELKFTVKDADDTICVNVPNQDVVFGISYLMVPKNMEKLTSKKAIHPITKLEIPIFSGNIKECKAGLPAYNKQDYKFALKHKLDINRIIPMVSYPVQNKKWIYEQNIVLFVKHYSKDEYLYLDYNDGIENFIDGDSENGESHLETAFRLLAEQSGYVDVKEVDERPLKFIYAYYDSEKDKNIYIEEVFMDVKLKSDKCIEMAEDEKFNHVVRWASKKELKQQLGNKNAIMNEMLIGSFNGDLEDKEDLEELKKLTDNKLL